MKTVLRCLALLLCALLLGPGSRAKRGERENGVSGAATTAGVATSGGEASATASPAAQPADKSPVLAATPPMGWNSWDALRDHGH